MKQIFILLSLLTGTLNAHATVENLFPYSCQYQKVGQGDWIHTPYRGTRTPVALGPYQLYVAGAVTLGAKDTAVGAYCSGVFENSGRNFLFIQSATGTALAFTKAPTCMLSGTDVKTESNILEFTGSDHHVFSRNTFVAGEITFEVFYIAGIASVAGPQKELCDKVFEEQVGVHPK